MTATLAALAIAITTLALGQQSADAATVTLYSNITGQPTASGPSTQPVGPSPGNPTFIIAKPFVPTNSGTANIISVWSQCVGIGCTAGGTIQLRPDNGGKPG
jgi:hypothetical protein